MKKLITIILLLACASASAQNIFDHRGKIRMLYGTSSMDSLTIEFQSDTVLFRSTTNPTFKFQSGVCADSFRVANGDWVKSFVGSQWTTSGSDIYYNTGNVGINDATPDYKLDVEGSVFGTSLTTTGILDVGNYGKFGTSNYVYIGESVLLNADGIVDNNDNSIATIYNDTYFAYGQENGVTNSGLFINSGKVGVKTSTPSYDLDVVGLIGGSNIETNTTSLSTRLGYQALDSENETAARNNVAIGYNAGTALTTGTSNTFIGPSAGYSTTESSDNIFIGSAAGYSGTVSSSNLFIGSAAGYYNTTGGYNTMLGYQSGYKLTEGTGNTFTGVNSGNENTTGNYNVANGYQSNYTNQTGSYNVSIGFKSGRYNTLSNRLFINAFDRSNLAGDTTKSIIYGYMDADQTLQRLTFNAKTYVNSSLNYGEDGEASDTYVAAITGITAYTKGLIIYFEANTANTGACTININSLGAKSLKAFHDQDPPDNYIEVGSMIHAIYDGTNFQMLQQDANP